MRSLSLLSVVDDEDGRIRHMITKIVLTIAGDRQPSLGTSTFSPQWVPEDTQYCRLPPHSMRVMPPKSHRNSGSSPTPS